MSLPEIVALARKMRDTMRDGLNRAFHYLRSLKLRAEFVCWALLGT